jgi:hypothetical protein
MRYQASRLPAPYRRNNQPWTDRFSPGNAARSPDLPRSSGKDETGKQIADRQTDSGDAVAVELSADRHSALTLIRTRCPTQERSASAVAAGCCRQRDARQPRWSATAERSVRSSRAACPAAATLPGCEPASDAADWGTCAYWPLATRDDTVPSEALRRAKRIAKLVSRRHKWQNGRQTDRPTKGMLGRCGAAPVSNASRWNPASPPTLLPVPDSGASAEAAADASLAAAPSSASEQLGCGCAASSCIKTDRRAPASSSPASRSLAARARGAGSGRPKMQLWSGAREAGSAARHTAGQPGSPPIEPTDRPTDQPTDTPTTQADRTGSQTDGRTIDWQIGRQTHHSHPQLRPQDLPAKATARRSSGQCPQL